MPNPIRRRPKKVDLCSWCQCEVTPKDGVQVDDADGVPHLFHAPECLMMLRHFTHCEDRPRA